MTRSILQKCPISHPRYLLFFLVLLSVPWPLTIFLPFDEAIISGFDIAAIAFGYSIVGLWRRSSPDTLRVQAARDDGGRVLLLLLSATIVTAVIVALGRVMVDKADLDAWRISLLVGTLLSGWAFANLVFAIHYAHMFYDIQPKGADFEGLDFPGGSEHLFADFVNFAFVIGMTCQTADINITATSFRRVVTFHGLFAFIFNLGILALTVNFIAGAR